MKRWAKKIKMGTSKMTNNIIQELVTMIKVPNRVSETCTEARKIIVTAETNNPTSCIKQSSPIMLLKCKLHTVMTTPSMNNLKDSNACKMISTRKTRKNVRKLLT